ncbi:hypothetical protein ACFQFC_27950 [Amorphoplanes digitatis]|uniref:Uncharacterized protein n=1 Tax=Actinoplanes digitatis TaxID=1868 RepID=A0A7W7MN42_9ACTN|nr:hypothetical protein [Actinoplanes digitatis]MBB4759979.1 hypothetical protein [Actinoplanes digitatis]BFE67989.1 hypothetical protein GCM10020092_012900 [Actinoplanes digitatis]GID96527.1 hypothetical protein Adi01nite_59390 [Actinoplanes digitatis]
MSDDLDRLQDAQDDIHDAYGIWGANDLADACRGAAAVPGFGGDAGELRAIADHCDTVAQTVEQALDAAGPLVREGISRVWAGDTHVSADEALRALTDDMFRASTAFHAIGDLLRRHAGPVEGEGADRAAAGTLAEIATTVGAMTWGALPGPGYEGEAMRRQHARAIGAIDGRVDRHIAVRAAAEDLATALHEIGTQARTGRLSDSPLSAVDEVVIAGAGRTRTAASHPPVLTTAMDERAAAALSAMGGTDRERMTGLLAAARSPEHRAYLLKTLAAGYPVDQVARFDQLIAGHGDDPAWLDEHLSPLPMDGEPAPGKDFTTFGAAEWEQGAAPTCVVASTVTARAEIDPPYALRLTTGGHPGDPAFDNPAAFADRLRDEQAQIYDDGRSWFQEHFGGDGMTSGQSAAVADQEIAPRSGAGYDDVALDDRAARAATVPSIERAVDEGYPVPLFTSEDGETHQLMVIGHSGDRLQLYNPWGYTYWITEHEFVAGQVNGVDPDIPSTPSSVRLPERARG